MPCCDAKNIIVMISHKAILKQCVMGNTIQIQVNMTRIDCDNGTGVSHEARQQNKEIGHRPLFWFQLLLYFVSDLNV